ncbi:MAG TPA: MBL fold metallo-hydrolase, partial [Thermoanaerobaculia bacterium]|nr:MBL fold metallo-hydrolase [Thermoanaerobaculia bacterium]
LLLLLLLFTLLPTGLAHADLQLTYLANEGYLLDDGAGGKVLIDALFGDGLDHYPVVPPATRTDLEAGNPPFDGVDLLLATHYHDDHFDPQAVGRFLTANPQAQLLTTPQAVADLEGSFSGYDAIASRVRATLPAEGIRQTHRFGVITVTVFNLHHGRDRNPPVENLGFLVDLGGVRLLHVGDTEVTGADLAPLALDDEGIDVALLPTWMVSTPRGVKTVRQRIAPRQVVPIHFARRGDDRESEIRQLLPEAPILRQALATTTVSPRR